MKGSSRVSYEEIIRRIVLANAIAYEGKAQPKPVFRKLFASQPMLKKRIREITPMVNKIIREVNNLSLSEQMETVRKLWPEMLVKENDKVDEIRGLPPLPNVNRYTQVVTRFAPNPDCVLHLGSARAVILSHEYSRMYNGRFILRFEDTDPRLKKSYLKFFDLIEEDLKWLGCKWNAKYIQSDRIDVYYDYARKLLQMGCAYICTCSRQSFREKAMRKEPCPCRSLKPNKNLALWEAMLSGEYTEGQAVVRIKTDLEHPNPALRDWPALRIIDPEKHPHPRVGRKYYIWPLFTFANGIDDHLNGITHIIRGKEHLTNQKRQEYLYGYFGWKYPEAIHYGRLKIVGASLSKSKILQGVQDGTYEDWDDPRLATFRALKRRGISPEAIRHLIIDIGPKPVDITLSWENLYAYNRRIIDPIADRFFFVQEPRELIVKNVPKSYVVHLPFHPDYPKRGTRTLTVKPTKREAQLLVSNRDRILLKGNAIIRLMELFNIQIETVKVAKFTSMFQSEAYEEARRLRAPLIQWLPGVGGIPCDVVMRDGSVVKGLAEDTLREVSVGRIVQLVRFGFARVDRVEDKVVVFFAHK